MSDEAPVFTIFVAGLMLGAWCGKCYGRDMEQGDARWCFAALTQQHSHADTLAVALAAQQCRPYIDTAGVRLP